MSVLGLGRRLRVDKGRNGNQRQTQDAHRRQGSPHYVHHCTPSRIALGNMAAGRRIAATANGFSVRIHVLRLRLQPRSGRDASLACAPIAIGAGETVEP